MRKGNNKKKVISLIYKNNGGGYMEITKLFVKDLMNGKFELFCEYIYQTKGHLIKVPKGFIIDYASIPKLLTIIILPYGKHSGASVIHD